MRILALLVFNAVVLSFYACSDATLDSPDAEMDGAVSLVDAAIAAPTALERGEGIVDSLGCADCHQSADPSTVLAGADAPTAGSEAFGGNLTPDPLSGIGKWTLVQIDAAIRQGIGPDGRALCPAMPRYSQITDADLAAVVSYLQSLPPVIHTVAASVCPGAAASAPANATDTSTDAGDDRAAARDPTSHGTRLPAPGDLLISEVMDDPTGPEPNDEWFELHNVASDPVALKGLTVVDADSRFFDVTNAPDLPPGGFAIFARTLEGAAMTLVPTPAYVYGEALGANQGVVLLNDERGALAVLVGTILIDRFDYGGVLHRVSGASVERVDANDAGALGCVAITPWAADAGKGTPLAPTDCENRDAGLDADADADAGRDATL